MCLGSMSGNFSPAKNSDYAVNTASPALLMVHADHPGSLPVTL